MGVTPLETGYGKIGKSAKKSHKNDSGLQGFELIEAYKIITGKESIQWERFFELAPSNSGAQIQII